MPELPPSPMIIQCLECRQRYEVDISLLDQKVECVCGHKFYVKYPNIIECEELGIFEENSQPIPFCTKNLPNHIERNKIYCVTGRLFQFRGRKALWKLISERGGNTVDALNANVDYLIIGDEQRRTDKVNSAIGLGIKLLSESMIKVMIDNTPPVEVENSGILATKHSRIKLEDVTSDRQGTLENDNGFVVDKKIFEIRPGDTAIFRFEYKYYDQERNQGLQDAVFEISIGSDVAEHSKTMMNEKPAEEDIAALQAAIDEIKQQAGQVGIKYRIFLNTPVAAAWYQIYLGITLIMPPGTAAAAPLLYEQLYELLPKTPLGRLDYTLWNDREPTGRYWLSRIDEFR